LATDACQAGRVLVEGTNLKPSREVKIGMEFQIKKSPMVYTFKIKELPKNRVGAKLVSDYLEDLTPDEEFNKLEMMQIGAQAVRDRGAGRPTKKDRRVIDDFFS
jgi:ribosome-associated heat shock protein Hsp15